MFMIIGGSPTKLNLFASKQQQQQQHTYLTSGNLLSPSLLNLQNTCLQCDLSPSSVECAKETKLVSDSSNCISKRRLFAAVKLDLTEQLSSSLNHSEPLKLIKKLANATNFENQPVKWAGWLAGWYHRAH